MATKSFAQRLLGTMKDVLTGTLDLLGDPDSRAGLGLNPDATPDSTTAQAALDRVSTYFNSDDPEGQQYLAVVDDVLAARDALVDIVSASGFDNGLAPTVIEYLRFVLEVVGLNVVRGKVPSLYYLGRLLALIDDVGAVQTVHRLQLDRLDKIFKQGSVVTYYKDVLSGLPNAQARVDFSLGAVGAAIKMAPSVFKSLKNLVDIRVLYGWDALPGTTTPAEEILERTLSVALSKPENTATPCNATAFQACPTTPTDPLAVSLFLDLMSVAPEAGVSSSGLLGSLFLGETFAIDIPREGSTNPLGRITISATGPAEVHVFVGEEVKSVTSLRAPSLAVEFQPLPDPQDEPNIVIGSKNGTRLELGRFSARGEVRQSGDAVNYGIRVAVDDGALIVVPGEGDGFINTILKALTTGGELKVSFSLALGVSKGLGFFIEGGTGLRITLALGKQLGPLRLETLVVGVDAKKEAPDQPFQMKAELLAGLTLRISGVSLSVDQMGVGWTLSPLGSMGFRPPKGLAISIDLPPVSGGGYLFFDPDHGQYAGAVHIGFGDKLAINGVGVVQTFTAADGSRGYSFVVVLGVEFQGIQIGFGFTLNGVGGIFGRNRGVAVEALQAGIKTGALEAVLFPPNPVANAPRIVSVLSSVFPLTEGQTIFGPALKLGWGTPTLITFELGLIIEFEPPRRLILLGRAAAAIPKDKPIVSLEFDCIGVLNPSTGDSTFDASLYRSTVGPYAITGDLAWRSAGGGRPFWILAVGGTNPHFEVPKGLLPALTKVGINLVQGDNPRARLEGYTALTSNTFQIGGAVDASYSKAGFTLFAHIGADALINTATFSFIVDFGLSVALKRGSSNIASIGLNGTITGPTPFHVDATASIGFFFFSVHFHVSFSIGSDAPQPLPAADVTAPLLAACRDARNWSAALPANDNMMVGLRAIDPAAAPAGVVVHPLGEITLRQRVAPLDFVMQRFGVGAVSGNNKFTIQSPAVGGTVDTSAPAVKDLFAPGEFLNLSDHDKLSRPAFDSLTSGVTFSPTVPRSGEKLDTALKYKTIVKKKSDVPPVVAGHYQPAVAKFLAAVLQGAAAQSPLRQSGVRRFAGAANQLGIGETLFTVVSTADLRTAAGIAAGVAAGTSYTQAAQALRGLGARAGTVQVVALHEVAP